MKAFILTIFTFGLSLNAMAQYYLNPIYMTPADEDCSIFIASLRLDLPTYVDMTMSDQQRFQDDLAFVHDTCKWEYDYYSLRSEIRQGQLNDLKKIIGLKQE